MRNAIAMTLAVVFVLVGCGAAPSSGEPVAVGEVVLVAAVEELTVADEVPREGYERSSFRHWVDADGDGCDTREEVLVAEATVTPDTGSGCKVTGGAWFSFYDGKVIKDSSKMDIDHMVPLAEAWDSGAASWDADKRRLFANDLTSEVSLVAVSATSNRAKGDRDPGAWLPPDESVWCRYIGDWVSVKRTWGLSVDPVEVEVLRAFAQECAGYVVVR